MLVAGHGVLERIAAALADAFHLEHALAALAFDGDPHLFEADDLEGRPKQLPRHPAQLAAEDLREHANLLVGGRGIDDEDGLAAAVMNRFRPFDDRGALDAVERYVAASALRDVQADMGAAAADLRIGNSAEVAAPAEVTVAELVAVAAHLPLGRSRHDGLRGPGPRSRVCPAEAEHYVRSIRVAGYYVRS